VSLTKKLQTIFELGIDYSLHFKKNIIINLSNRSATKARVGSPAQ
jgi:hypothetical protein